MTLRVLLLAAGLVALAGSLAVAGPERFAVTLACAVVTIVLAAGAVAADAVPLRRVALACSAATLACGVGLLAGSARGEMPIPLAAAIVVLQVLALAAPRLVAARRAGA